MKSRSITRFHLLSSFVLLVAFAACNKAEQAKRDQGTDPIENSSNTSTPLLIGNNQCANAPNYGDSIIYLQPATGQYFVSPVNNIGIKGTYLAWPEGLVINSATGAINVSRSETGVRYLVGFVKEGTQDTCVSQLILGGITYADHIYVIGNNDTLAKPVFNANPLLAPVCDASDDNDYPGNNGNGNNKCSFDNNAPGSKANDQALRVRTLSGIINLKRSLADGLFGPNPRNGMSKVINVSYTLNDNSNKAQQQLTIKVMYYDKVSSIPANLQSEVQNKSANLMSFTIVSYKPRPPLLIIAGYAN
ncbi:MULTISPECIES: hypothetical protein [Niastella]|uniref:Lipoprotein n=1 Tax=Niastella soli TaxID=2821487 RepID=A0ABS3Z4L5_9BACT|nr:hypothetical protein [Niastella soli]MBO9204595.1 hypothetical protein [Niastella soli]